MHLISRIGLISLMILIMAGQVFAQNNNEEDPEKLVQEQLEAYNNRDVEAFVRPYSDNVKVFDFPDKLLYEGKEEFYGVYARFFGNTPELHCELVKRMTIGNTVIDQEKVTLAKGKDPMHAIAIYKIHNGKIAEVYFIRE